MEKLTFKVNEYEGPLDLILALLAKPMVSVASRIMHLLRGFYRRGRASLQSIWADNHDRSELVATFMAVLELLKAGRVHLTDDDTELVFAGREKKKAES